MKYRWLIISLLWCQHLMGQNNPDKGIHFEHNLNNWDEIKEKAKRENKYIFLDLFTTWCVPCKYMDSHIFSDESVGAFFNQYFVSIKIQCDSSEADNDNISQWYTTGYKLMDAYNVQAFPTYLLFNSSGDAVHKLVGSNEAEEFLLKIKAAFDTSKQFYTLLKKYKKGEINAGFLQTLSRASVDANEITIGEAVFKKLLTLKPDLTTKENLLLVYELTSSTNDPGFRLMLKDPEKFNVLITKKRAAEKKLINIILYEKVMPKLFRSANPDLVRLQKELTTSYPKLAKEVIAIAKMDYYHSNGNRQQYFTAVIDYIKSFGQYLSSEELNQYAWEVFDSGSPSQLEQALKWSKSCMEKNPDATYIDTYANLLYKLGRSKEAIEWETKAISLATEKDKEIYRATLTKMQQGKKTRVNKWLN